MARWFRNEIYVRCLKITEKVLFNIKNLASFWKPEVCGQTVLPDRSISKVEKIGGKCKNSNATFWVIFKQCDMCVMWGMKFRTPRELRSIYNQNSLKILLPIFSTPNIVSRNDVWMKKTWYFMWWPWNLKRDHQHQSFLTCSDVHGTV